jgi:L-threonylcarbamoyladenylate synthase
MKNQDSNIVDITQAIRLLKEGSVGVMLTDTVYGLVARAEDQQAVARMYRLKDRDRKPGTLIAASATQLRALGVDQEDIDTVAQWWPNPISAVLIMHGNEYLHQGVGDIAMRIVADSSIRLMLEQTGPLITSSANLPSQPGATSIAEAYSYFKEAVDFYVDGGVIAGNTPSTIIRPSKKGIEILRQGSIHI